MAARTDVSFGGPGGDDGRDITRNLDTPDAIAVVERTETVAGLDLKRLSDDGRVDVTCRDAAVAAIVPRADARTQRGRELDE
jgi:hypothetical protein